MPRRAAVLAVLAVLAGAALTSCASSWDQSVARATQRDQPLVVEFYASWCKPCRRFEQVLGDPEVVAALQGITFERYDFDSSEGQFHARRLGVRGVPTVLAVGRDGVPIGGLKGASDKPTFLDFLSWTRARWQADVAPGAAPGAAADAQGPDGSPGRSR